MVRVMPGHVGVTATSAGNSPWLVVADGGADALSVHNPVLSRVERPVTAARPRTGLDSSPCTSRLVRRLVWGTHQPLGRSTVVVLLRCGTA